MGIGTGETREDADGLALESAHEQALEDEYERALEDAYAEAAWEWSEADIERIVFGSDAELGESGFDEHARARIEDASATGLVYRLEDETSPFARGPRGSGRSRTVGDTLDLLRAADRLASWVAARQALLTAEVYHKVHGSEVHSFTAPGAGSGTGRADPRFSFMLAAEEIAPLLRVPGGTAQRMVGDALRLSEDLPGTWEALDAGRISPAQAQVIVDESGSIPAEAVPGFETTVLESAGELTRPKLTRRCRRLREELHPETITVRKARAVTDREVSVRAEQDGMAWLGAYLPAEQAHGIFNRVDAAARSLQGPGEPRTLSQLRADVFADVLTHTCAGDPKKGTGFRGVGATVFVTVPVMTLLGRSRSDWQNPAGTADAGPGDDSTNGSAHGSHGDTTNPGTSSGTDPGTSPGSAAPDLDGCEYGLLDGYGPIDPETARNLAAHAPSFTRILVHPETGAVLSVGRDRYRPPKHLQDWVRIKQPTCIHPGCNRSSWSCEIDHVTPWAHGGKTSLDNLGPRCKLHHMMKTEGIWPAGQDEHGNHHVTSLGGKTYTTPPEPPPPF